MKSLARRARSRSPFGRRKRADELISEIRQVVVDDTPVRYNRRTGREVIKSVLEQESGVELVLDRQQQQQKAAAEAAAAARLMNAPASPVRINVMNTAEKQGQQTPQAPHSDSHTLSTASTSVETPSRSLASRSLDALSPTNSLSTSSNNTRQQQPMNKRALFKKRFMKLPETKPKNPAAAAAAASQQQKTQQQPEQPAAMNRSTSAGRPRVGVRSLLCQKYKPPENDELYDDNESLLGRGGGSLTNLSTMPAVDQSPFAAPARGGRGRDPASRVAPSTLVRKRTNGQSRSTESSPAEAVVPRIMRRLKEASFDEEDEDESEEDDSDSEEEEEDDDHQEEDQDDHQRGRRGNSRPRHASSPSSSNQNNHHGTTASATAKSSTARRSGNNRGRHRSSTANDVFDAPKPKSIRVGRTSSNVSRLTSPDLHQSAAEGAGAAISPTKNRSLGEDSIDAIRRALSQVQRELSQEEHDADGRRRRPASRNSIAQALLQVADTLESPADRQALTRHASRLTQQHDEPEQHDQEQNLQHPLWSREASDAYRRRRAQRDSGGAYASDDGGGSPSRSRDHSGATSGDEQYTYSYTDEEEEGHSSSGETPVSGMLGGIGSPFDFLWAGFEFPGLQGNEEGSEFSSRRGSKAKERRREPRFFSLLDETEDEDDDDEADYSSGRDADALWEQRRRQRKEQQQNPRKSPPRLRSSWRDSPSQRDRRRRRLSPAMAAAFHRRQRSHSADDAAASRGRRMPRAPTPAVVPADAAADTTIESSPPRLRRTTGQQQTDEQDSMSLGSIDSSQFKGGNKLMALAQRYDDDLSGDDRQGNKVMYPLSPMDDGGLLNLTGVTPITAVTSTEDGRSNRRKFHVVSELLREPDLPWESSHYLDVGDDEFSAARNSNLVTPSSPPRETRRMFF